MSLHASVSHAVGYASISLSFQLADDETLVHVNGSTLAFQNLETFHHDVLVPSTSPRPIVAFDINWTTSTLALTARERHAVIAIYSYPEKKLKGHLKASRLDVVVEYTCLKFSHCGRRLLSLCPVSEETFQVAFWDLKTFSLLQSVSIALTFFSFASFDPQNWNQIVLGGDTGLQFLTFYQVNATNLLRITSVANCSPLSNPTSVENEPLSCHTWLDSHRVVVATSTGAFHLVETTKAHVVTKSIQPALPSIPASIIDLLVVSPHLLVAYTNGTLAWLQLDTWHLVHLITLPGFHLPSSPSLVTVLKPTPSHSKAFIGTSDGQLVELSTSLYPSENTDNDTDNDKEDEQQTRRILHPLVSFHSGPLCATTVLTPFQGTFSIDAMVATGALSGVLTLSGLSNGLETARFHITSIFHDEPALRSSITALAASPGDPFLVLGDAQGRVRALSVLKTDSDNVHVKPLYSFQLMPLETPLDLLVMHPLQPLVLVASTQSHHVFLVSLHPDDRHAPILAFFTLSDHTERVWAIQWQESTDMTLKWTSLSSHGVLYTADFQLPDVKGLEKTVELKPHPIATSDNPLVPCLQVSFVSPRVLIGTSPNASDLFLLTFSPSLPLETSSLHSKSLVQRAHSRGISVFTLFSLENNIQLLVTGGMDGVLSFWTLESSSNFDDTGSNLDDQIQATKHQTLPLHTQAITCLNVLPALQNSSLQVLSTSVDGSIFLLNIHLPSSKFSISNSSSLAPGSNVNVLDTPFFSLNPTPFQAQIEPFLDTKARLETSNQLDKIDPQTQHVRNQLETLQRQLDALIVANQELPLEDQVPRDDLVINLAWKDAFTRQTSAKVESIRHESTRTLARLAILRDRLKRDFYDPLAVPPSRLYAFPPLLSSLSSSNQLAFVSNFPLPRPTTSDQKLAKQLHLLRSIELAYHQTQPQSKRQPRIHLPLNLPWLLNAQNEDNMTPLLYPPAALLTRHQVRLQVHFLQAYTRSLAQAFNVEFEAIKELKATIFDQLEANQRRIQELTNNANVEPWPWPTSWQLEEQVDGMFKVQAIELIHNKPYETVAERVRREQEAQAAELESHSRRNEDVRQRALQDMMNGTIEGTKAPRSKVEQQGHDVDVEVQGLRADQVDWMRAFNDKLRGLEERYRATKRAVGAQELYVLCFGEKLMIEEALRYEEEELEATKRAIDALQAQAQDESTFLKAQVEIGRTHVQRALERDTQVDKSVVKELEKMSQSIQETTGVSEGCSLLLELYRQRGNGSETSRSDLKRPLKGTNKQRLVTESHTRKDQRRQPTVSTRTSSTSLEMPLERPKGLFLDEEQWHSFLALRRKKLHSEHVFNEKTTALAALKRLSDESSTIVLEIQRQGQELGLENEKRIQNRERTWHGTVPLLVSLKQGQDETLEDVIERREALKDRWLVPRTSVEALNGEIQRHGAFQLTLLERIKTFRKRLNLFEWEHMKLELERRDRDEEYTDLHLLRVTKDVQELLKTGDTSHQQKRQVAALEATLMQLRRQYALQMEQVERKETIWRRQLHDRERERETYQEQVTELERNVAIRQEVVARRAKKEMNRKKQDIKHKSWRVRRRLIDVIKVQTKDIEALRREMDTMRARTYPRFIQEEKLPVDLKQ